MHGEAIWWLGAWQGVAAADPSRYKALHGTSLERYSDGQQQLEAALGYVREGDQFVCTKLGRLARSVGDLLAIVARAVDRFQCVPSNVALMSVAGLNCYTAAKGGIAAITRSMAVEFTPQRCESMSSHQPRRRPIVCASGSKRAIRE